MKIGIDLDGVLRDIHTPLCDTWYRKTGIRKSPTDLIGWNCHQYLEIERVGMAVEEFYQWWFNSNYIYALATVIPNSQDAIAQLAEKHDLILVSSQPTPNARLWAIKFVDRYFLGMFKAMYFGKDKSLVYLDAMVDDAVHNLTPNVARHRVLFNQPWNQDAPGDIYRANGWQDVLDYFGGRRWE